MKTTKKRKKYLMWIAIVLIGLFLLGCAGILIINICMKNSVSKQILTPEEAAQLQDVDCILVLGCQVHEDGEPSHMLRDRLTRAIELYKLGAAPKLLMSGDHGQHRYDEVNAMKQFALDAGVPAEDIFMDHAGFSTYESMYRAKEIFGVDKILIVTQEYHLYRAMYISEQFDMETYGVASDLDTYSGQFYRDVREVLARAKDFAKCIFKPEPTFLGEEIPISGDGNLTNG